MVPLNVACHRFLLSAVSIISKAAPVSLHASLLSYHVRKMIGRANSPSNDKRMQRIVLLYTNPTMKLVLEKNYITMVKASPANVC